MSRMPPKRKRRSAGNEFDRITKLSAAELAKETAHFDKEMVVDESRPLTRKERADFERFQRKMGRPVVGRGAIRVSVSIERGLLEATDKAAKKAKIKRSQVIDLALRKLIAAKD